MINSVPASVCGDAVTICVQISIAELGHNNHSESGTVFMARFVYDSLNEKQ